MYSRVTMSWTLLFSYKTRSNECSLFSKIWKLFWAWSACAQVKALLILLCNFLSTVVHSPFEITKMMNKMGRLVVRKSNTYCSWLGAFSLSILFKKYIISFSINSNVNHKLCTFFRVLRKDLSIACLFCNNFSLGWRELVGTTGYLWVSASTL